MTIHEKFIQDMEDAGFSVRDYAGRFFWKGPAVATSRNEGIDIEDIIRATDVKLQSDSLGLDQIVYPVASAKAQYKEPERCEECDEPICENCGGCHNEDCDEYEEMCDSE
jgi:hypothetical protein